MQAIGAVLSAIFVSPAGLAPTGFLLNPVPSGSDTNGTKLSSELLLLLRIAL